jgi:predicted Zn-dependent protease
MFNAGYLPSDASEFFLKMAGQNQKKVSKYLDTHPPLQDRADYMLKYLQSFPTGNRESRKDSEELQRIKARLATRWTQQ